MVQVKKSKNQSSKSKTQTKKAEKKNSKSNQNNQSGQASKVTGNQSLAQQISAKFDDRNKVEQLDYDIQGQTVSVFYIDSLVNKAILSSGLIAPLNKLARSSNSSDDKNNSGSSTKNKKTEASSSNQSLADMIAEQIVAVSGMVEETEVEQCLKNIFSGQAVVVAEDTALCYPVFGVEQRSIAEPPTSRVVKGPREGFIEDVATNIGLVRKRIKSEKLKIEDLFVGKKTDTQVSLIYVEDVVKKEVLEEVKAKIKKINIDAIIDSYYIESFLEDNKLKLFRRVGNTEKPDIFCAKILEGRVGILVNGSPIALTVPFILFEDMQSPEDYYSIPAMATFSRIMRFFGLIMAVLIPGVYVALQSFNYRILPINFLITLLSSIEGLSIPPLAEILIVLMLFEIITEASLQMPSSLGMALSIIGALALGNTAVDAGLISAPSIVVVAISSVAIYIIPHQINETRFIRLLFTVVGGVTGLYGVLTTFILLTTYLTSIRSFGVPYMVPYAPNQPTDKKDAFVKKPIQSMKKRPALFAGKDKVRQGGKGDEF